MKKYSRVFKYISQYKSEAFFHIIFIILAIIISLVSLGMLFPCLELIFNGDASGIGRLTKNSNNSLVILVRNYLINSIHDKGKIPTLGVISSIIIVSVFLKNL